MNSVSRIITGTLGIILGLVLVVVSFSEQWILIYAIPLIIIGIFILFNKKEDDIERVRTEAKGGKR